MFRRFLRWCFHLAAALSLLLCILTALLWACHIRTNDDLVLDVGPCELGMSNVRALLTVWAGSSPAPVLLDCEWYARSPGTPVFGFDMGRHPDGNGITILHLVYVEARTQPSGVMLAVPFWFAVLVTAPLPLLWLMWAIRAARAGKRRLSGLCPHCGYDLRASPERCPECGAPTPAPQSGGGRGPG